jgi:DNA (cytosine-5)-methyltransferase 1
VNGRPTFGSLFAGIGGIDLGLERAGWECRFQVEWDPFCQRVLAKHWPDVPRYGDITTVDWSGVERVDLLAGGFPCQPVSVAGKQLAQDDSRWLWPEFERAIRALRPGRVLVENVPGLLARGMGDVLGGLADLGYDAEWRVISAADAGAPHLRKRVWIVATDTIRGVLRLQPGRIGRERPAGLESVWEGASESGSHGAPQPLADPLVDALGQRGRRWDTQREDAADVDAPGEGIGPGGYGGWWATEPDVGRVAHGVPARVDRLRSLGNAVVPQVVEYIGRRLLEAEAVTA